MKAATTVATPSKSTATTTGAQEKRPRRRVCMAVDTVATKNVHVMRAATALANAGIDVTIVDVEQRTDAPRQEVVDGITLCHIIMPSWYISTHFKPWFLVKYAVLFMRCVLRLACLPTEVYHAQDQQMLPVCWLASLIRRKSLVYDAYEIPLTSPVAFKWRRLRRFALSLLRPMVARCDAVIVVSPPMVEEFQCGFGGPVPVVVRNILPYQLPRTSNRLREHLGLSNQTRIALYQGMVQPNRELDRLVHAAHYLGPNTVIVILGSGPSWDDLGKLIEREGLQERVRIVPAVPYEELLDWTASADLGLIIFRPDITPNIKVCLPNKLFEFLMAGLPVLASDLPAVADLLSQYQVGRVLKSLEPRDIGAAITTMLEDCAGRAAMHERALDTSARELRWEVESQRLVHLYDDMFATAAPLIEFPDNSTQA